MEDGNRKIGVKPCHRGGFCLALVLAALAFLGTAAQCRADSTSIIVDETVFSMENFDTSLPGTKRIATAFQGSEEALLSLLAYAKQFIGMEIFTDDSSMPRPQTVLLVLDESHVVDNNHSTDGHTDWHTIYIYVKALDYLQVRDDSINYYITGLLYHESTHVYQNTNYAYLCKELDGVREGIATYIRMKAGFETTARKPGGNWYDGYSTTANFLQWLPYGAAKQLNMNMVNPWNNGFFKDDFGKSVEDLWSDYQAAL